MKTAQFLLFLLLSISTFAQTNLSGLYRVSLTGAVYATNKSPNKSLLRGTSYFVMEQQGDQITIQWGGLNEKLLIKTLKGRVGQGNIVAGMQADTITASITATLLGDRITGRFVVYYFGQTVPSPGWATLRFNATKISENCTSMDEGKLTVKNRNDKALLTDGAVDIATFENRKAANAAKKVLKDLEVTAVCKVLEPYPSFIYFKKDGVIPSNSNGLNNCKTIQLSLLSTQRINGIWTVLHDGETLFPCKSRHEAQSAIAIMKYHEVRQLCTLGAKQELKLIFR